MRHWLDQLALLAETANRIVWPVALDATAYNMPVPIKSLNYFRPTACRCCPRRPGRSPPNSKRGSLPAEAGDGGDVPRHAAEAGRAGRRTVARA